MKRLFLMGVAVALAAFVWAGGVSRDTGTVNADPFPSLIDYNITWGGVAAGTSPNLNVQLNIDCPGGVCPALSSAPFFDIAVTQYSANVHSCTTGSPAPCTGPIDTNSIVGTSSFSLNTNLTAALLPDNVNPTTGAPATCGGPGTTTLSSAFSILSGANNAADQVSGKDGGDADNLPDTQADVRGLTSSSGPNGAPDGSDALPDYIQLLLTSSLAIVVGRGYGIAQIVPNVAQTDVNFLTLNLTGFGAGYAAVTTLGDVRPANVADPDASQTTETCAPFTSNVNTTGTSANNPNTAATEVSRPVRVLTGAVGDPINYAIVLSGAEDVDGDGTPATYDQCPANAGANGDADGDGMGDVCDDDPATVNNCPGSAQAYKSAACNADATGAPYNTAQPWDPDQDVDGDGFANFFDNCPKLSNAQQLDRNSDGLGDACQTSVGTASGPRPERPSHDHDEYCTTTTTTTTGTLTPAETCLIRDTVAALQGSPTDSNDDGFPDFLQAAAGQPILTDKGSDSDWDGCSDHTEAVQAPAAPCSGDPRVVNSNGGACVALIPGSGACVDGNKDRNGNTVADWKDIYDAAGVNNPTFYTADSSPLGSSPDSDGDGCTNRRENLAAAAAGGTRDATNRWDFYDVDVPPTAAGTRNKVVNISDTLAILPFIGTNASNPNTPNGSGKTYGGDDNQDGFTNGEIYDRSPAGSLTGPPSGAVAIADALSNLPQIGANCSTP